MESVQGNQLLVKLVATIHFEALVVLHQQEKKKPMNQEELNNFVCDKFDYHVKAICWSAVHFVVVNSLPI